MTTRRMQLLRFSTLRKVQLCVRCMGMYATHTIQGQHYALLRREERHSIKYLLL